jgi:chromosome segregation ATPase
MARTSDWPLSDTVRLPASRTSAPERPRRRRPHAVWAIAAATFVCGALISAAAFSVGWRHQAQRGSSAEAALAVATARNHTLAASLDAARADATRSRAQAADARKAATSAKATADAVSREAATLAAAVVRTGRSADSVSVGAASLGANLDKLSSELKTLTSYLDTTPAGQLDAGYVASQTAYIAKQLDRLGSERSDLTAAVATFDAAAKKLADRAATLSGRN